jgi:TonB family protein
MPPLSLLFSSDEETSRVLIQALQELEFEVEHCPEIFAAVQRLTSRKLDVVVADWDDGLEASFLLKTVHELKSNSEAFTVAVVSAREAEIAARHVGADCVLTKPFNVEQIKYALLTCDAFLAHMRGWLPKILAENEKRSRNASPISSASSPEAPHNRITTRAQSPRPTKSVASGPGSVFWQYAEKSKKAGRTRANRFLIAAIATTLLSCAYVLDGATEAKFLSMTIRHTLDSVESWSISSQGSNLPANVAIGESRDSRTSDLPVAEMPIRVIPAHHNIPDVATAARIEVAVDAAPSMTVRQLPSIPAPTIPESLRSEASIAHSSPAILGSTLLSTLEPVNITEDLSENLLLEKVQPSYPEQAVRSGLQGSVVLQALIGRDGRIQNLKLVQGSFLLGQSAYQAVKQWRYRPYFLNGRAVQAQTFVTVDFSLPTRSSATLPNPR